MPYSTVVSGTTITASWGNANVRDQVVTPFASAAARDSAITSPVEGMVAYLADVDLLCVYHGASWFNEDTVKYVASDVSITSQTTLQNVTGLVFAAEASSVYVVIYHLFYDSGTVGDLKLGWTVPSGMTVVSGPIAVQTGISTGGDTSANANFHGDASTTPSWQIGGANSAPHTYCQVAATFTASSTAGNVQLQYAQTTSDSQATKIKTGSWMRAHRVA